MQIKFKDLELALDYIKQNGQPERVEFEEARGNLTLSFTDKNNKPTKIVLYGSEYSVTPEVLVTTKLYKSTVIAKQETKSVDET